MYKQVFNKKVGVMVKIHMMKAQEGDFIWLSYGDMEKEYHKYMGKGKKEL